MQGYTDRTTGTFVEHEKARPPQPRPHAYSRTRAHECTLPPSLPPSLAPSIHPSVHLPPSLPPFLFPSLPPLDSFPSLSLPPPTCPRPRLNLPHPMRPRPRPGAAPPHRRPSRPAGAEPSRHPRSDAAGCAPDAPRLGGGGGACVRVLCVAGRWRRSRGTTAPPIPSSPPCRHARTYPLRSPARGPAPVPASLLSLAVTLRGRLQGKELLNHLNDTLAHLPVEVEPPPLFPAAHAPHR